MQKFSFTSIRDSIDTRRVQVMLRRNPVYIPSHLGAQDDRDAIRAAERREALDNPNPNPSPRITAA
jgi:hypothetical protein